MVEGKDNIKDLFSEKLTGFEANVRPELWANISSQIGVTTGAVATGGLSILTKAIIGITAAASIVGLSVVLFNSSEKEENQKENRIITEQEIISPKESETVITEIPQSNKKEETNLKVEEISTGEAETEIVIIDGGIDKIEIDKPIWNKPFIKEDKKEESTPAKAETPEKTDPIIEEPIINENEIVGVKESKVLLDLPNVFTPNGDNANDFLFIETTGLTDFSIVVIDQKNTIVYKSNEPTVNWDGTGMNGDRVPTGNYVYYITARDADGNLVTRHSTLRIER